MARNHDLTFRNLT